MKFTTKEPIALYTSRHVTVSVSNLNTLQLSMSIGNRCCCRHGWAFGGRLLSPFNDGYLSPDYECFKILIVKAQGPPQPLSVIMTVSLGYGRDVMGSDANFLVSLGFSPAVFNHGSKMLELSEVALLFFLASQLSSGTRS